MRLKLIIIALFTTALLRAQLSLTDITPSATINFSSSMQASVGNAAFTAAGFQATPAAGQLDSDAWAVTGWTDGNLAFGGTRTTAATDYTRGSTAVAVTSGGVYSYTAAPQSVGNPCLMIQPGGSDFAPGTLTLRIQNNGTSTMTQLDVSYNLFIRNDQARGNSFNFSYSADDATYTPVAGLDYTSTAAADALGWVQVGTTPSRSTSITGLNVAPGAYFYIRWSSADVTGSGSRDEFGLDDIICTASYATSCTTPTTQASTVLATNATVNGVDLSWTAAATATGTMVVISPTASASTAPTSGTGYTANTAWGSAAQIDTNNRVVYRGTATSVTGITGLTAGTQYTATIYAYNDPGSCYNLASPETVTFYTLATEPTAHPASFTCATATTTQINLSFSAPSSVSASGYMILYNIGSLPTGVPIDGATYSVGTVFGNSTVLGFTGSAADTIFPATGLNGGTNYYFILVPYSNASGIAATTNYRTVATIKNSNCTTTTSPEINVKGVVGANPSIADGDTTPQGTDNTLFATVVVGNSQAKVFRIENLGNAVLNVTGITMVGGQSADFVVSGVPASFTVAVGATQDFTVTFSPSAAGTRSTTLTIANNDSNENPYDFLIQGTGTLVSLVDINVKGNGQSIPDNSIYPVGTNWTAFGVATVGSTTVTRTFTIENLGSTALTLSANPLLVNIVGTHASQFSVTAQPSSSSIAGGGSLTFDVTFNPTAPGAKNATINIYSNDPDEALYNFNISGTAKGANNIYVYGNGNDVNKGAVTTSATNLTDFGSVAVTTGVKQNTFVISNLSTGSRYFGAVTISGADASMFSIVSQPTNNGLGSGNSTAFTINFTPTSTGTKNATVTFATYTNSGLSTPDPVDPTFSFAISGFGETYTSCSNNTVQTIVIQDFEASPAAPTWGYTYTTDGTVTVAGGTYNNGSGAKNAFLGARSFQFTGIGTTLTRSAVVSLNAVDVSLYNNINLSFKTGAFRASIAQGLDVNDLIQVESSVDGGVNWSTESVLRGYTNSRWDFSATGVFNAYYTGTNNGATIDTRNGNAELAAGYATYNVKSLPAVTNLLLRITLVVDRDDEVWAIDDLKIEGQIAQSTTWNGSSWSAGAPTSSMKAIIAGPYSTAANGNITACECQVNAGSTLTIDGGTYLEVQSNLTNDGTLTVSNNGSLVQVNDAAINKGNIIYNRDVSIKKFDYVYWSSPVDAFPVLSLSPTTLSMHVWKWLPTVSGNYGTWSNAAENMIAGKGYIVRGPSTFNNTTPAIFTGTFTGLPNNGRITTPIERGSFQGANYTNANGSIVTANDDNWNLLGNPYPSSIKISDFWAANTNIEASVRIWTHGSLPNTGNANPFYNNFLYNYNSADYIVYNTTGTVSGPGGFNGYVAAGQGFFVLMNDGPADASQTVGFSNSMRSKTYSNSQFYRHNNVQTNNGELERNRIWLDLIGTTGSVSRTLLGYIEGATTGKDRLFDAVARFDNGQNFYSIAENHALTIQGRPAPLDDADVVPLGMQLPAAGEYKIAIAAVDGSFTTEGSILLEDKQLQLIHDLRQAPYVFTAQPGESNTRFVLRYNNANLETQNLQDAASAIAVVPQSDAVQIRSAKENITAVAIYDVLGREIVNRTNLDATDVSVALTAAHQTLIVKIKLSGGQLVTRKIIF